MNHEGHEGHEAGGSAALEVCAHRVVDSALSVHRALGPGLLESAYQSCLVHELSSRGCEVQVQVPLPINYRGVRVDAAYRIDLLVDNAVVVELKTVAKLLPVHDAQLLSYLKMGNYRVGFLVNFHVTLLKHGIKRLMNGR